MADILNEIVAKLPKNAEISHTSFEAANIIVYTKSKEFFLDNRGEIKKLVSDFKKRIELRPDPSISLDIEQAEKIIRETIPAEANVDNIIFDAPRSTVIIETEKPGVAIGISGELLKIIKEKTLWVPIIRRMPSIRSKITENIRAVLYENNDSRKKFLNEVGKRIYNGWIRGRKNEWVRVTVLGAGRQVGRSCFLLQTPESRIVLDCGINPAAPEEFAYPHFDSPEFRINEIDAVIISHAHLDHSAMVPLLVKYGYSGPIYCTEPTRDIMSLLALDFISIGFKDARKPPFDVADVKQMVKQTICINYEEVTDITPDIRMTFYNAGHILGSAMTHLHIGNGLHNLLYTGDMLYDTSNLLAKAITKFPRLETVIIESTYGSKDDILPPRKESEDLFMDLIKKTIERGGKILLPVLGVGRSQEIMLMVERAVREGTLPKIPIHVQGLVWDVTAIHTTYPEFFNPIVRKQIFFEEKNPFLSDIFKRVGSQKEMQEVMHSEGSSIIIATSGMLTGGASVEYFKVLSENPKNIVILTSYQAEGSLGRRVQNGEKEISFASGESRSEVVKVRAEIAVIKGFSGHSSRPQLMAFLRNLDPKPKRVITQHGEASKCLDLASTVHKVMHVETSVPRNLDTIRLV
ncbi:MAG: beta-CASP ribonuclease aCPSF1 [bacterium]|nr:beta-CASP ribonuclease aCPSF1 [bacterium]